VTEGRVLLIEDEAALARGLSDTLRARGFEVEVAHDGQRGLDAALSGQVDLILLDVMLPKINGYEICRAVRGHGIDVPILMLTAKGQEEDVVLGLNLGADDYITKPFRIAELIARAHAFLRRRGSSRIVCRFGDCEIDLRARKVLRAGTLLDLTAKEFATRPRALPRRHPQRGVGQLGVRHAAQHRSLRHHASREDRAGSPQPDLHPDDSRDRLSLRAEQLVPLETCCVCTPPAAGAFVWPKATDDARRTQVSTRKQPRDSTSSISRRRSRPRPVVGDTSDRLEIDNAVLGNVAMRIPRDDEALTRLQHVATEPQPQQSIGSSPLDRIQRIGGSHFEERVWIDPREFLQHAVDFDHLFQIVGRVRVMSGR
jgi:DNA-binding response OmpR family regulator